MFLRNQWVVGVDWSRCVVSGYCNPNQEDSCASRIKEVNQWEYDFQTWRFPTNCLSSTAIWYHARVWVGDSFQKFRQMVRWWSHSIFRIISLCIPVYFFKKNLISPTRKSDFGFLLKEMSRAMKTNEWEWRCSVAGKYREMMSETQKKTHSTQIDQNDSWTFDFFSFYQVYFSRIPFRDKLDVGSLK
jgi:hypothetical protein